MKVRSKKSLLLLVLILVAPIFLLVGCGEVQSYNITATTNCQNGNVIGMGKYDDGSRVTLTARGIGGNKFIAWVYQNKTILQDGNTYSIVTSDDAMTSTISFTVSSYTADNYTAIFEDSKQMYYTLSSYRVVSHQIDEEIPEENIENQSVTCVGNLSIQIGENVLNYRNPVNLTNQSFLNTTTNFSDISDVFKLSSSTPYYLYFSFSAENFSVNKTVSLFYGATNVQDDVNVTFESDGDIVLTYSFNLASDDETTDGENEEVTTLILTVSPLR